MAHGSPARQAYSKGLMRQYSEPATMAHPQKPCSSGNALNSEPATMAHTSPVRAGNATSSEPASMAIQLRPD